MRAETIFADLGPTYERAGAVLSFGQDPRWRRFLVSRVPRGANVLDVATGTGAVARLLLDRGCTVTGLDQSEGMLREARRRLGDRAVFLQGRAETLPFPDASFDALTFTYLLRYVDDPPAVLRELTRVVRPGGTVAMLEFFVPRPPWLAPWRIYVERVLPRAGRAFGPQWEEVGRFLARSIPGFWARVPLPRLLDHWRAAGVEPSHRILSFGAAVVVWGTKG